MGGDRSSAGRDDGRAGARIPVLPRPRPRPCVTGLASRIVMTEREIQAFLFVVGITNFFLLEMFVQKLLV